MSKDHEMIWLLLKSEHQAEHAHYVLNRSYGSASVCKKKKDP
jgi:hypothetical protein